MLNVTRLPVVATYPSGARLAFCATPTIMSNINFIPGRDIPNMVSVQLPEDRTIDFYTAHAGNGQTNLKVDLVGYVGGPRLIRTRVGGDP